LISKIFSSDSRAEGEWWVVSRILRRLRIVGLGEYFVPGESAPARRTADSGGDRIGSGEGVLGWGLLILVVVVVVVVDRDSETANRGKEEGRCIYLSIEGIRYMAKTGLNQNIGDYVFTTRN
jgi:hypothetical protein